MSEMTVSALLFDRKTSRFSYCDACSIRASTADILFAFVLFLTVTDSYRLIAVWGQVGSLAPLTGVFALAALLYALFHSSYSAMPFSRFLAWTTFVLLLPVGSVAYSLNPNFRDIGLQISYFSLLCGSKVFFSRATTRHLRRVLLDGALVSGFTGVILSILRPDLFKSLAQGTDFTTFDFAGRGYGFYLQPNICAASITLLFFLWLFVRKSTPALRLGVTVISYQLYC